MEQRSRQGIDLASLEHRAAGLYQRFGAAHDNDDLEPDAAAKRRLDEWLEIAGGGDRSSFLRRLSKDHLDETSALRLLGAPQVHTKPAVWIPTLSRSIEVVRRSFRQAIGRSPAEGPHFDETRHQFQAVLEPIVRDAERRVLRGRHSRDTLLVPGSLKALTRWLLDDLAAISCDVLSFEFECFQTARHSSLQRALGLSEVQQRTDRDEFTQALARDGLASIYSQYPVLAELVGRTVDRWMVVVQEFLSRLDRDAEALSLKFGDAGAELGAVSRIECRLSDRHNGGRSVFLVHFESGADVVYKPKDLQIDHAFAELLQWLSVHGFPCRLRVPRVLPREDYGWAERIERRACHSESGVSTYFYRFGCLLAVAYALGATDLHSENVIASGDEPVVLDLETLFHAERTASLDGNRPNAEALAQESVRRSVLRTLLLPNWVVGRQGNPRDMGALVHAQVGADETRPNQDGSRDVAVPLSSQEQALPLLVSADGTTVRSADPSGYADQIVLGFTESYRFLAAHKDALLASDGPIEAFKGLSSRFVLRPTLTYATLIRRSLDPACLRDGLDRGIQLDALSRGLVQAGFAGDEWAVLRTEHEALWQLDIPYFKARIDSTALVLSDGLSVPAFFSMSGLDAVTRTVRSLDETDLRVQTDLIRASFGAYFEPSQADRNREVGSIPNGVPGKGSETEELLAFATLIADHLERTAVRSDETATWVGLHQTPPGQHYEIRPVGHDLYAGGAGIAVFLAGLSSVTGNARYVSLSRGAVDLLVTSIDEFGPRLASRIGVGGFTGIGGMAYALSTVGRILGEEAYVAAARRAALGVTSEFIRNCVNSDLVTGLAGYLVVLLDLAEDSAAPRSVLDQLAEKALLVGTRLAEIQEETEIGGAWRSSEGLLLTGLSHGAAGISMALAKLWSATRVDSYQAAARNGLTYERAVFDRSEGNWPDFAGARRHPNRPVFMTQWCHGAPGIALSRMAILEYMDEPLLRDEIEVAIETTLAARVTPRDHLCCGNLGRALVLLEAGRRLSRPGLVVSANDMATTVIRRAAGTSSDASLPHWGIAHPSMNPGLMQGIAGIGYALLQLARPELAPSVLLLGHQRSL